MNVPDDSSGMKIFTFRKGNRRLFTKLCLIIFFMFCALCVYNLAELRITTEHISQWNIRKLLNKVVHTLKTEQKSHLILLWTTYFGKHNWLPSTKSLKCPVDNCQLTSNRLRLKESSAVIMHWRNIDPNDLPKCPFMSELTSYCPLMVLFNKESPSHTSAETLRRMNDKIHWTVTYRKDSDIKAPYGSIVPLQNTSSEMPDIRLNRSSICWLVSNCHTPSQREKYVDRLRLFIPVDVYGKCGNSSCPYKNSFDCYKWLSHRCKFYLSFENSICKDYCTEKLYYPMMTDMLPIVLGGYSYAKYLPQRSFINVDDYSSPEDLAKYLQELQANDSKYLSYFQWRREYLVQDDSYMWLCELCEKLNTVRLNDVRPYETVMDWWYKEPCEVNHNL